MRRWLPIVLRGTLCLGGAQLLACDQMPPIDQNYDSTLGEDFRAPPEDAAVDAGTPDAADAASP